MDTPMLLDATTNWDISNHPVYKYEMSFFTHDQVISPAGTLLFIYFILNW